MPRKLLNQEHSSAWVIQTWLLAIAPFVLVFGPVIGTSSCLVLKHLLQELGCSEILVF